MAALQTRKGPNRWVVLHSERDTAPVLQRLLEAVPDAVAPTAAPVVGPFSAPAIQTRQNLSPVPPEPRRGKPFLVEFTGSGGVIVWPGSQGPDPQLVLDAVLVPPAGAPTSPTSPQQPIASEPAPTGPLPPPRPIPPQGGFTIGVMGVVVLAILYDLFRGK